MKLYLDPGHGGSDSGAAANGLLEKNLNLSIALKIRNRLQDFKDIDIRMSRTTDEFLSLQQRTDDANNWGAHYFLSIHINAFNGSGHGYEDFIHDQLSNLSETAQIRDVIHAEIIKEVDFYNRGKKKANFHVLRESNMPAMLSENGFIDNPEDAAKLKSDAYLDKIAQGHVNGIVKAFSLKKKAPPKPKEGRHLRTGGLTPEMLADFTAFLQAKNWFAEARIREDKDKSTYVITGGLTSSMKKEAEAWLDARGWWYTYENSMN